MSETTEHDPGQNQDIISALANIVSKYELVTTSAEGIYDRLLSSVRASGLTGLELNEDQLSELKILVGAHLDASRQGTKVSSDETFDDIVDYLRSLKK